MVGNFGPWHLGRGRQSFRHSRDIRDDHENSKNSKTEHNNHFLKLQTCRIKVIKTQDICVCVCDGGMGKVKADSGVLFISLQCPLRIGPRRLCSMKKAESTAGDGLLSCENPGDPRLSLSSEI